MKRILIPALLLLSSNSYAGSAAVDYNGMSLPELKAAAIEGILADYQKNGITGVTKRKIFSVTQDGIVVEPVSAETIRVVLSYGTNHVRTASDIPDCCMVDLEITHSLRAPAKISKITVECGSRD